WGKKPSPWPLGLTSQPIITPYRLFGGQRTPPSRWRKLGRRKSLQWDCDPSIAEMGANTRFAPTGFNHNMEMAFFPAWHPPCVWPSKLSFTSETCGLIMVVFGWGSKGSQWRYRLANGLDTRLLTVSSAG